MLPVRLRTSRWLTALALLASPAGLGTALPLLHPCPVDAPWLAEAGEAGHHGHGDQSPAEDQGHPDCSCIGACLAGAALLGTSPQVDAPPGVAIPFAGWVSLDASLQLAPVATLLPPATAPPGFPA
jgi:hypothetical protein